MRVVLVVGLVFVVFDADEVGIDSFGVKGERDDGVDGDAFVDEGEDPCLYYVRKDRVGG